jgi:drug/metabolite transporter (DMT)-like permease
MPFPESEEAATSRPGLAIALRLASIASTAALAVVVKLAAARGVSPVESVFYRYLFSLMLVAPWVLAHGGLPAIATKRLGGHIIRAMLGMGALLAVFFTVTALPLPEATTILFTAPLIATALSIVLLREPVGIHRWFAIGLGVAGMVIMMQPGGHQGLPLGGFALGLLAATLTALSTITIRQLALGEGAMVMIFWFTVIGTIATGLAMPFFFQAHDGVTWLMLIGAGLLGTAGQVFVTSALRYAPVALLAPFEYSQLLWATFYGWLIWSDLPSVQTIIGAVFIAGAGLYTFYREHLRHRPPIAETTIIP